MEELPSVDDLYRSILGTEKQLLIDVSMREERFMRQRHILKLLELLSTLYPEVKKVRKLIQLILQTAEQTMIPSEIKIPVVSSFGIKAVIKIGDIDHTEFQPDETQRIFVDYHKDYHKVQMECQVPEAQDQFHSYRQMDNYKQLELIHPKAE